MTLSDNLKKFRKSSNLTQSQVAEKLHVSRKTISGWENSHSTPDIVNISKLSDIYHVSLDYLIHENNLSKFEKDSRSTCINFKKIYRITYFLNYFSIFLLYIELFRPYGLHSLVIPTFSIINEIFLISSFPNWSALRNQIYLLKLISLSILEPSIPRDFAFLYDSYAFPYIRWYAKTSARYL